MKFVRQINKPKLENERRQKLITNMKEAWSNVKDDVFRYQTALDSEKPMIEEKVLTQAYAYTYENDVIKELLPKNLKEIKDRITQLQELAMVINSYIRDRPNCIPTFKDIKEKSKDNSKLNEILTFFERHYNIKSENNNLTNCMVEAVIEKLKMQEKALEELFNLKENDLLTFILLTVSVGATIICIVANIIVLHHIITIDNLFPSAVHGTCALLLTQICSVGTISLLVTAVYLIASEIKQDEGPKYMFFLNNLKTELIKETDHYILDQQELNQLYNQLEETEKMIEDHNKQKEKLIAAIINLRL